MLLWEQCRMETGRSSECTAHGLLATESPAVPCSIQSSVGVNVTTTKDDNKPDTSSPYVIGEETESTANYKLCPVSAAAFLACSHSKEP